MTTPSRVLTEPRELIIEAVAEAEPALKVGWIAVAVDQVADTVAKLRRLAVALAKDADLLTSGRPEGPRLIELLIRELQPHNPTRITPPRCGRCDRPGNLARVVEGRRMCQACAASTVGKPRSPCAVCGKTLEVSGRDRDGRPRCRQHRPEPQDEIAEIAVIVNTLDTGLSGETLTQILEEVLPTAAQRRGVLQQLRDRPTLLTGEGAHGSPRVIALTEALISRGARSIIAPSCPICGRTLPLRFKHGDLRCCRRCYAIGLRRTCGRCGEVGDIASRTPDGDPVCDRCTKADPANHETCGGCGRRAPCRRGPAGTPLCRSCHTEPVAVCSRCGKSKPCYRSTTETPICLSCSRGKAPCVRCGNVRLIAYRAEDGGALCQACGETTEPCSTCGRDSRVITRTSDGPICRNCHRADPRFLRECRTCGTVEHLYHDLLCNRCAAIRWLRDLFADPDGAIRPDLEGIVQALTSGRPLPLLNLLERTSKREQLQRLRTADGGLDHDFLDQLGTSRDIASLRAALVAAGLLPLRDEYLVAFEAWLTKTINQVEKRDDLKLIRSFSTWSVLRQLRRASARKPLSYGQVAPPRTEIRAAIRFLSWLRDHDRTLATCTQADLDAWLTSDGPGRQEVRRFISWATKQRHLSAVTFPNTDRPCRGQTAIEDDERWRIVHQLLHDDSLDTRTRVAGCLVLLYGQTVSRIASLTADQIIASPGRMRLRLGTRPVDVPAPLGELLRKLAAAGHHPAVLGETGHRWLFPGQYAGKHIHPASLNHLLNAVGAHSRPGRSTALMDLASHLPAVVVSKLLGLHISTATEWTQAAGNTRPGYAATVARRRR